MREKPSHIKKVITSVIILTKTEKKVANLIMFQ